jgi:hypothetical protein
VGEVVALRDEGAAGELLLAALLSFTEDSLEVAPLSVEVGLAAEWDLMVGAEDGPLGYEAIAEVWNHGRIAPAQVAESLGVLSEGASEALLALYCAVFVEDAPEDARTGPPILSDEDPRNLFQEREAERARRYWSDSEEVGAEKGDAKTDGIGALLWGWMEEVGNDPAGLATEAGWMQGDLDRLLREEVDRAQGAFAAHRVGELLALTTIEPDDARLHLGVTLAPARQEAVAPAPRAFLARPVLHRAPASVEKRLSEKRGGDTRAEIEAYIAEVIETLEELRG